MKHNYIIVDDSHESILNTQATAMRFQNLSFAGYANKYDDALNLILEHQPSLLFLEINPAKKESNLSLSLINELHRYLTVVPKIIVTSKDQSMVFRAMEYGVADYLVKPLDINAFRKAIFKFEKAVAQNTSVQSIIQPETVPQRAFTFSDFLRQEPIVKPIVQEEATSLTEEKGEIQIDDIEVDSAIIESQIDEENVLEEIQEVEENETSESDNIVLDEEQTEETIAETNLGEEVDAISTETTEIDEEVTVDEQEVEEPIFAEEEETEEVIEENQVEENDAITILPGQKVIVEQEQPLIICVKSYGDYRYIDSRDVLYLEADNNSTDIHLKDGEMVTAFKTLKVFENVLPETQFLRIHNSYIINIAQVARIHTGNSVCYIKNSTIKLPFSKSYKENVELIIHRIASGNYLEI